MLIEIISSLVSQIKNIKYDFDIDKNILKLKWHYVDSMVGENVILKNKNQIYSLCTQRLV